MKYFYPKYLLFVIILIVGFCRQNSLNAQFYSGSQMSFGKNRIQYDDERTWTYFRFKNFDTYFYADGKALAIYTSSFADKEIKRLSKYLGFALDDKIKFIIFNDLSDLKESNIGLLTNEEYNIGGETYIVNNKVFIYFNGNHKHLESQISKGIAQVFLNQIMYGGSFSSTVKNSVLLTFPDWFSNGFVSFMAEEWNTEIDAAVREGFLSGRFKDFKRLSKEEQTIAGHSLWKYINDKYGHRALSDVLFLSKINRSVESGFLYVLDKPYAKLMEDWQNWYLTKYKVEATLGFTPPESPYFKRVSSRKKYSQPRISYDGKYMAVVENEIGRVKLKIVDIGTKKSKVIEKYGYKLDEKVDYTYPVCAWAPNTNYLTYIIENKGDIIMVHYDVAERKKKKKYLNNFDKILSISYNSRGNLLVMSAVQKGQSDIFIYNIASNTIKRITYDIYDNEEPVFVNGGNGILFSSNRISDTLKIDIETGKNVTLDTLKGNSNHDIFFYDLHNNNPVLKRVTETPLANETQPQYLGFNQFAWLSNQSGIYNLMVGKFDSVISYIDTTVHYKHIAKAKIGTNYFQNIKAINISSSADKLVEIIPFNDRDIFYIPKLPDFKNFEGLKDVYTTFMLSEIYKERKRIANLTRKSAIEDTSNIKPVEQEPAPVKKKFNVLYVGQSGDSTSIIDVNNYNVGKPNKDDYTSQEYELQTSEQLYRPINYEVQYSITELVSQMDFSYMNLSYQPFTNPSTPIFNNQGFAAYMKFGVMDLLEEYRVVAGVKLSPTFSGNEYLFSFSNLKKRLDKEYTLHRMVLSDINELGYISDYVHEGFAKFGWPFDNVRSLRATFSLRNDYLVQKAIDHLSVVEDPVSTNRGGLKLEYIFDNTRNPSLNILYGTRYKIFAEYYQPLKDLKENTYILGFDFRKYTRIVGKFIWANRLAGSTSFGTQRLIYYLGGVDNWMFPNFNSNIQIDKKQEFIYQTTATNMRGFDQNIRNGNSFLVLNTELRLPPFALLSKKPIKSDFLTNFQMIGFFDVGTAWSGPNPFSDENSLFRQEFYQKPITVIIINQNDPIVAGYGFGIRSRIFGYFVRADWAWGIQNGYRQKTKFYLSLSLDF